MDMYYRQEDRPKDYNYDCKQEVVKGHAERFERFERFEHLEDVGQVGHVEHVEDVEHAEDGEGADHADHADHAGVGKEHAEGEEDELMIKVVGIAVAGEGVSDNLLPEEDIHVELQK